MPPFNGVPYCEEKQNILIDKGKPRFNQPFGIILRIGGAFDGGQKTLPEIPLPQWSAEASIFAKLTASAGSPGANAAQISLLMAPPIPLPNLFP